MSFANRFSRSLLAAAMENQNDSVNPEAEQDLELAQAENETMTGAAEVEEAEAEVNQMEAEIEEGLSDVDTLNDVADTLEATEENGGATQTEARLAEITVESIYAKWNEQSNPFSSMEDFGDSYSRLQATRVAVESIREKAAHAAKVIREFFVNLFKRIAEWFNKMVDQAHRVSSRAEKIGAVLKKDSFTPASEDIVMPGVDYIYPGENSMSPGTIGMVADSLRLVASQKAGSELIAKMDKKLNVEKLFKDDKYFNTFSMNIEEMVKTGMKDREKFDAKKMFGLMDDDETQWVSSGVNAGIYAVAVRVPRKNLTGKDFFNALGKSSIDIVKRQDLNKEDKKLKIRALDHGECLELCEIIKNFGKDFQAAKKALEVMKAGGNDLIKSVEKLGKDSDKDGDKDRMNDITKVLKFQGTFSTAYFTKFRALLLKQANAALDYVEASMKAAKKEANKKD